MTVLRKTISGIISAQLSRQLAELNERAINLVDPLGREVVAGTEVRALSVSRRVLGLCDIRMQVLDVVVPRPLQAHDPVKPPNPLATHAQDYIVSSIFLEECYPVLTLGRAEQMHAVTGIRFQSYLTLERIVRLDLETQSAIRATATPDSVFRAMLNLAESGHVLHAVFHSHRMRGPPSPSSVDKDLQQGLDRGGYPAIQAIFSEDGFIRFFGGQKPFTITVYGTGVERLDEKLYRLADER